MSAAPGIGLLKPRWSAPPRVRAAFTLRSGGVSAAPWASLNLGQHVGDDPRAVAENRRRVVVALRLPAEPIWLDQVHGVQLWRPSAAPPPPAGEPPPQADAVLIQRPGVVGAIMVADCIPVLFSDRAGSRVAAAHAGWRGLAAGVLENTVAALQRPPSELCAWLGPAIGSVAFEVGDEVRSALLASAPGAAAGAAAGAAREGVASRFRPSPAGRWLCDLAGLARDRLAAIGVRDLSGGEWCTASDPERFFSHRRDAPRSGRMAALIWIEA